MELLLKTFVFDQRVSADIHCKVWTLRCTYLKHGGETIHYPKSFSLKLFFTCSYEYSLHVPLLSFVFITCSISHHCVYRACSTRPQQLFQQQRRQLKKQGILHSVLLVDMYISPLTPKYVPFRHPPHQYAFKFDGKQHPNHLV